MTSIDEIMGKMHVSDLKHTYNNNPCTVYLPRKSFNIILLIDSIVASIKDQTSSKNRLPLSNFFPATVPNLLIKASLFPLLTKSL